MDNSMIGPEAPVGETLNFRLVTHVTSVQSLDIGDVDGHAASLARFSGLAFFLGERVRRGEFEAVVEELAATITHEGGPRADDASSSFRRMARRAGPDVLLRQNTSLLGRPDRRPDLAGITCPTLLLWGREDRLAGVEHGREMASDDRT